MTAASSRSTAAPRRDYSPRGGVEFRIDGVSSSAGKRSLCPRLLWKPLAVFVDYTVCVRDLFPFRELDRLKPCRFDPRRSFPEYCSSRKFAVIVIKRRSAKSFSIVIGVCGNHISSKGDSNVIATSKTLARRRVAGLQLFHFDAVAILNRLQLAVGKRLCFEWSPFERSMPTTG